ncbi:hypothetical protein BDDG_05173 [Blastomyces dermatitidis ATCC 18188]|uniref:DUF323 domain-containing protein n=1 Tax=Ajellomyces dermatitidis (strain ATCC 18188 / CBS 674.68) TaxID=653446 RepID=F2TG67_AJEDA|nr:hypothetical protein BDDG_05173 [Blastomyces dermatitidis ATCC 18188]
MWVCVTRLPRFIHSTSFCHTFHHLSPSLIAEQQDFFIIFTFSLFHLQLTILQHIFFQSSAKMAPSKLSNVPIMDIHVNDLKDSLVNDIYAGLKPSHGGAKSLPTLLLYSTEGLRQFEDITYVDEYYLTNAEIEALTTHAAKIVNQLPENAQLLELGSGNLRKIKILLDEFERKQKAVEYFALDLSREELHRTFAEIPQGGYKYVRCRGLHGTYDDALIWLTRPENRRNPTCILSMGSSIGNFTRPEAAQFLNRFSKMLGPSDSMLIGIDSCQDPERVYKAYNDSQGVTRDFYMTGLSHANSILGFEAFKKEDWGVAGHYDVVTGAHMAYYVPNKDVTFDGVVLEKGEKIFFEQAFKYGPKDCKDLFQHAGLTPIAQFGNNTGEYYVHLLSSCALEMPTRAAQYAENVIPNVADFENLWKTWDMVTLSMIPQDDLLSKPIRLRNALIFYLGHIPAFLDIHLTRATDGTPTEPKHFQSMFERGIDPDVDNPELCHDHSDIPSEWPPLGEILTYRDAVRSRTLALLEKRTKDRRLAEALWIGFEHEAMHLETFLYMLLQSDKALPPPGVLRPNFESLARQSALESRENSWFTIPEQQISIGLDDPNEHVIPKHSFSWDNEKPKRNVNVSAFAAQARPITNGEYATYLEEHHITTIPATWIDLTPKTGDVKRNGYDSCNGYSTNGVRQSSTSATKKFLEKFAVRTVFGPVPLKWALNWPLMASYNELQGYAESVNCRIPTFEEVRSIYQYSAFLKSKQRNGATSLTNGHSNVPNGTVKTFDRSVEPAKDTHGNPRSPDHQPVQCPSADPMPVYIDLDENCNVGLKHWHPTPVTQNGDRLSGQGELGGVWEWTSTPLHAHEGFKAMDLYPGYSADFFDGKHNIVLGVPGPPILGSRVEQHLLTGINASTSMYGQVHA